MGRKSGDFRGSQNGESTSASEVEKKLIDNLIVLQKVNTDLAEKFDKLSNQLSDLLRLFEMAARSFAEHPAVQATEKDKEFLDKIDKLLDQNKTIAKGLTIMEEKIRDRVYGQSPQAPPVPQSMAMQNQTMQQQPMSPSMRQSQSEEQEPAFKFTNNSRPLPRF